MTLRDVNCHASGVARGTARAAGDWPCPHVGCRRISDDEEALFGGTLSEGGLKVMSEEQTAHAAASQHSPSLLPFSVPDVRKVDDIELMSAAIDSAEPTMSQPADSCAARKMNVADGIDPEVMGMHDGQRPPAGTAVATYWRLGNPADCTDRVENYYFYICCYDCFCCVTFTS